VKTRKTGGVEPDCLLISNRRDLSLDWIVRELERRAVPFYRLNTELAATVTWTLNVGGDWSIGDGGRQVRLSSVGAVLYRRPEPPRLRASNRHERQLARRQWSAVLAGLQAMPGPIWISPPSAIDHAEAKLVQLEMARRVGFDVPDTLITNARGAARAFARRHANSVVKALDAPLLGPSTSPSFVFATLVSDEVLSSMEAIERAPLVFQQAILPKADVRATVVGDQVFGAVAESSTIDWRVDPGAQFRPLDLPGDVSAYCVQLTNSLGLRFAGIDLLRDRGDRYWFLELNPNGEWGWLQAMGIPIAEAIVDVLTGVRAT
jgi:glutathione synthase/RimK-type ligase-like ATP-grasp enzyme